LSSLGIITNIRLRQLQHLECLTQSPIVEWPYISIQRRHYTSFLASSISLCRLNNISFECPQHLRNIILDGTISIRSLLTHQQFLVCRLQLIRHNILFLEQLTFVDGRHLCSWCSITKWSFTAHKVISKTPKWFSVVETQVLVDLNSRLLQPQFISTYATHFKGFPLQSPILESRSKEWVGIWSPLLSLSVFGKIIEKHQATQQVLIQHWIHDNTISNYDEPCLSICNGCILHTTNKESCSFWTPINLAIVLLRTTKQDNNSRQLRFSIDEYSSVIAAHYNFSTRNLLYQIATPPSSILQHNLLLRYV
jgi:hypothetical protein